MAFSLIVTGVTGSQVRKLEADIMPLQESNAELSEKSGMLQAEKKLLEEDIKRWKARTQVSVHLCLTPKFGTPNRACCLILLLQRPCRFGIDARSYPCPSCS